MIVKNKNILIIGDVMLDLYVKGQHNRMSPEADCAILDYTEQENRLGGAANVALNISHLDQNPILVSIIGDDENGKLLTSLCEKNNIEHKFFIDQNRPTTTKTRFIDDEYNQFLRLDNEVRDAIPNSVELKIIANLESIDFTTIDLIIIQDYNKGLLTPLIIKTIQEKSRSHSIKLCVDPKHQNFKLLSDCDLFKPNLKELGTYLDKDLNPDQNSLDEAITQSDLYKEGMIITTLSEYGIYYRSEEVSGQIDGQKIDKPDVSGAGDTVIAILGIFLISSFDIEKMAEIANRCGAIVCQIKGISTIKTTDLEGLIL